MRGQESVRQRELLLVKVLNNGIVCYTLYLEAVGMYAEGVRRGKSGIGDSVEKQVHDEKKGIYN